MIEDDRINGRDGNDILEGNASSDVLLGGSGNDIIYHWTKEGFEGGDSTHSDIFDNVLV
jgi:Ca2+-binding RTX toxin-like protein